MSWQSWLSTPDVDRVLHRSPPRRVLPALFLTVTAIALSAGWSPVTAGASPSVTPGYLARGPVALGDASGCGIAEGSAAGFNQPASNAPVVGMALTVGCTGGWLASADGGVFSASGTAFYGSAGDLDLNAPIVGMAATPDGKGYWLVAADGGIFTFGDAGFYGSLGATPLHAGIVGMTGTPDGRGYWLVGADGGVFTFGDASFHGSMGATSLNARIVGMTATTDGDGYWLVAADGGVFSFGDAPFYGSLGGSRLAAPVTAMATTPDGKGYWLAAADGGVFTYGDAGFDGSLASPQGAPGGSEGSNIIADPIIALAPTASGRGYLLLPAAPALDPTDPGHTGFALARQQWLGAQYEAAVYQSTTWLQAGAYLTSGQGVDPGDTSAYAAAIGDLVQLAGLPEMDVTPPQRAQATADFAALNRFFDATVPG